MGLDITAYKNTKVIDYLPEVEDWEDKYYGCIDMPENTAYIDNCLANHFPEWAEGLEFGAEYQYEDCYCFCAGSYSGYNYWRNWLSLTVLGISAATVWANKELYQEKPFYRLINFSDCEGVIGPIHSAKLAEDLKEHQSSIDELKCEQWLKDKYANWKRAFEHASENGYVDFC